MTPKSAAHDRTDVLHMIGLQRGDALGGLNESLYLAARAVLSNWEKGDLAEAVRELQTAVDALDDHHDEVAAIEAGWERRTGMWMRFAVAGETIDPELPNHEIWIFAGMLYAYRAEHALTQDEFRDLKAGAH